MHGENMKFAATGVCHAVIYKVTYKQVLYVIQVVGVWKIIDRLSNRQLFMNDSSPWC